MKDFFVKCFVKSIGMCFKGIVYLCVLVMLVFEWKFKMFMFLFIEWFVVRGNYNVLVCLWLYLLDCLYKMNIFVKYGDINVGVIWINDYNI